jgi:predicted nucleotidyltransferase
MDQYFKQIDVTECLKNVTSFVSTGANDFPTIQTGGSTMDQSLISILKDLEENHQCHTAILYGSRARDDFSTASDYDIIAVKATGERNRDNRFINGLRRDVFIYPEADLEQLDESMLRIHGGIILKEKDRQGQILMEKVEKLYRTGPKMLPDYEIKAMVEWYLKMIARVCSGGVLTAESLYRRLELQYSMLPDYFKFRSHWYLGAKTALSWLKDNDPETYVVMEAAIQHNASDDQIKKAVYRVTSFANVMT